jgi:two-component system LytT family response regulator
MIHAFIVDDEPLARQTLALSLQSDPEITVVGSCSGAQAAEAILRERPELLFLDVQMPEVSGFDVLEAIGPDTVPIVVFVTAYDQYALKAFEVHALDYLLKPFDDRRFRETLSRAKARLLAGVERRDAGERVLDLLEARERAREPYVSRFLVRERERSLFIPVAEVDWIEAADDYVELHVGAQTHLLRERLAQLEQRLDPAAFVRIHRRTIVNIERVRELRPLFRGDSLLRLLDGTELRLSRSRRGEFERRLGGRR